MDDLQAIRCLRRGEIGGLEMLFARYQAKAVGTAACVLFNFPLVKDKTFDPS